MTIFTGGPKKVKKKAHNYRTKSSKIYKKLIFLVSRLFRQKSLKSYEKVTKRDGPYYMVHIPALVACIDAIMVASHREKIRCSRALQRGIFRLRSQL